MIKKAVQKALKPLGYEIRKTGDGWLSAQQWDEIYRRNYSEDSLTNRRFYNIGAGLFSHWAWTNVDKLTEWYKPLQQAAVVDYDLLACIPMNIESDTAEVFYTSHTIEHVNDAAVANLCKEAYRCLKPGGYFRITCPNIDLIYRAYLEGDRDFFYWQYKYSKETKMGPSRYAVPLSRASLEQMLLVSFVFNASEIHADHVDPPISDAEVKEAFTTLPYEQALDMLRNRGSMEKQLKYPGNHINWWNPAKTEYFLKAAGFKTIYLSGYGQSFCPVLRDTTLFDKTHPKMSLYIEAVKN